MAKFARPKGKFKRDGEKVLQLSEQFLILITCRNEKQQVELLGRFQGEGLECKALVGWLLLFRVCWRFNQSFSIQPGPLQGTDGR